MSQDERTELERLIRRRSAGQALVQRARIVLACAGPGATNAGVARALSFREEIAELARHLQGAEQAVVTAEQDNA